MNVLRRVLQVVVFGGILFVVTLSLPAQSTQSSADTAPPEQTYNPIPKRLVWPGIAIIILIAIFAAAALAGPIIRANHDDSESTDSSDQSS
jgi:hypothetical protein